MTTDTASLADAMWADYVAATGVIGTHRGTDWFGDTPELADQLLALVMDGTKRATCCLARDFADEPLPAPGDHWIITDGEHIPRCIIKTTHVELRPIREVDAAFARTEGEGDKSLAFWKSAHDAYFTRQGEREGFAYDDSMIGICEEFERVWPPDDRPDGTRD